MKSLFYILFFTSFSFTVLADVCICQYPKEDSKFGTGIRREVGFYKAGCAVWLLKEKHCRKEKIVDINVPLDSYLNKVLKENEKIRLGYVGHWSSSSEYVEYLKTDVEPILQKFNSSIEVENTACLSMSNANRVQEYLNTIPLLENQFLKVIGTQTISIGVWDNVLIHKRKADLVAVADTRLTMPSYPLCREYLKRNCTSFQIHENGLCTNDEGDLEEITCNPKRKISKEGAFMDDVWGNPRYKNNPKWELSKNVL